MRLQRLLTGLTGPDPVRLLDRRDEHLAVADLAGARVLEDRVDDRLHVLGLDHALELHLGPEVVRQLRSPVLLCDAFLAATPLALRAGEGGNPDPEQLRADRLERLVP